MSRGPVQPPAHSLWQHSPGLWPKHRKLHWGAHTVFVTEKDNGVVSRRLQMTTSVLDRANIKAGWTDDRMTWGQRSNLVRQRSINIISGLFVFLAVTYFNSRLFWLHCEHFDVLAPHQQLQGWGHSQIWHMSLPGPQHGTSPHASWQGSKTQIICHQFEVSRSSVFTSTVTWGDITALVTSLTLRPVAKDGDVGRSILQDVQPVHLRGEAQVPVLNDLDSSLQNLCGWHTNT